jgi:hypothetical protein
LDRTPLPAILMYELGWRAICTISLHRGEPSGRERGRHRSERVIQTDHLPDPGEIMWIEILTSRVGFERLARPFFLTLLLSVDDPRK